MDLDPTFTSRQLKIFREYLTLITLCTLMKPQMLKVRSKWIFLRYYSEVHGEVKVRFLKAVMFGHAFAKTVADEIWRTLQ